ncbi:MAG: hypothetical protein R3C62_07850 [Chloroflexota bacterium]
MKTWLFYLLVLLLLFGCQQPQPTPTPDNPQASEAFTDTPELLQARFALLNHLVQAENITAVPTAWEPQQSHEDDTTRTYTFRSGDWLLEIEQPLQENPTYHYRTLITGPDNFRYAADISANNVVSPAQ